MVFKLDEETITCPKCNAQIERRGSRFFRMVEEREVKYETVVEIIEETPKGIRIVCPTCGAFLIEYL